MPAWGLVGHTGFVGGNLANQREFSEFYNSSNVDDLAGRSFDRLYVAGAPAEKWLANQDPAADEARLDALRVPLLAARADVIVFISTVDVYPEPVGVDEATASPVEAHPQAYGRNRLRLEQAVRAGRDRVLVVRLPALFGRGLKKNLVFDLMHGREREFCHRDSSFQFYDLERLADDIDVALAAGLDVVNLGTEPVAAAEVARQVFARELHETTLPVAAYDMRTRHAGLFGGGALPYVMTRAEVLERLEEFVAREGPRR